MSRRRLLTLPVRVRRERDERGAYAILFSMMLVLVLALAAIAVDIASTVASKQQLKDTMDAAAHAAAFELDGNAANAADVARRVARANDLNADPTIDFWCVVSSMGEARTANQNQIPGTCNPGTPRPVTAANYPGMVCDTVLCFIPCVIGESTKCNTIRIADKKVVPYAFAPAIGYDEGSTGAVVSVACKGSCGTESPNPLDVVIMADRTASMPIDDREGMKGAILRSLETMNPEMHHVAFGALHKSRTSGFTSSSDFNRPEAPVTPTYENCNSLRGTAKTQCEKRNDDKTKAYNTKKAEWESNESEFARRVGWNGSGDTNGDRLCRTEAVRTNGSSASSTRSNGTWVPVGFSKDYLKLDGKVNPSSALVDGVSCLGESPSGEYGTHLAGALKGAARAVLGGSTLPGASARPGEPKKVIIFETDGQPDEVGSAGGSTSLSTPEDVFGGQQVNGGWNPARNGTKGCNNFLDVARNAKAQGITIITIGFGGANTAGCERYFDYGGEPLVRNVLAQAASPVNGVPATASFCDKDNPASIEAENRDGDLYFCAAKGDELAEIFATAMTAMSGGIKLLKMPK